MMAKFNDKANSKFKRLDDEEALPVELYAIEQPELETVDDVLNWLRGGCIEWLRAAGMVVTDGDSDMVASMILHDVCNLIEISVDAVRTGEMRGFQDCSRELWKNYAVEAQYLLDKADNIHGDHVGAVQAANLLVSSALRGSPIDTGCAHDRESATGSAVGGIS